MDVSPSLNKIYIGGDLGVLTEVFQNFTIKLVQLILTWNFLTDRCQLLGFYPNFFH